MTPSTIDSKRKGVAISRQGQAVEIVQSPSKRSGEEALPGFVPKVGVAGLALARPATPVRVELPDETVN